jgi:preprotein translocase subunit SecY
MTEAKKRRGAEMKKSIAITSMLLFVFAAQVFGLAYGIEEAAANDAMNATQINETINNANLTNETLGNETLENVTLINGTFENASLGQNESDPFTNAKNRKPSSR